jgi:hypothetical protein
MQPYFIPEYVRLRHADLLRDAEAYRAATAHRPRRPRRLLTARRRTA